MGGKGKAKGAHQDSDAGAPSEAPRDSDAEDKRNACKEVTTLLRSLFGEGVGVVDAHAAGKTARKLDLKAFHTFTLQRAQVQCEKHTIEQEVADESRNGGVELRAFVKPGFGFKQYGGIWLPDDLHSFLSYGIVVFVCGFNDVGFARQRGGVTEVCNQIDAHVKWYKWFGAKLVFIEMDDGHGNQLPWMTRHFQKLAATDQDVLLEHLQFPESGWASENYEDDTYHLTREGLLAWLHTKVKPFALALSRKLKRKHVVFVTDSSFQAHDYQAVLTLGSGSLEVVLQTLWGDSFRFQVDPKDRVGTLKQQIANRFATEWMIRSSSELRLVFHGRDMDDRRTVESYRVRNGSTVLLRMWSEGADGEMYYVSSDDFFDTRGDRQFQKRCSPVVEKRGGELYTLPHNGELKRALNVRSKFDSGDNSWLHEDGCHGEWAVSFHGTGLHNGATMAEDGFVLSCGSNGIYSSPQLEVAFKYAPIVEQHGRQYHVVVQNRVNPSKITKVSWPDGGSELWVVPDEEDIRPYGIFLREAA